MEKEQYFKCPVCGKKVLKRKGIKLMWTTICEDCFDKVVKNHDGVALRYWYWHLGVSPKIAFGWFKRKNNESGGHHKV